MSNPDAFRPDPLDQTPVLGVAEIESGSPAADGPRPAEVPTSAAPPPAPRLETAEPPAAIRLRDSLSRADVVVTSFPARIGNGRHFDLPLRGPGPSGEYAVIHRDAGTLVVELSNPQVFMAVQGHPVARRDIQPGAVIKLDEHEIEVLAAEASTPGPDRQPDKPARWGGSVVAVLVAGAVLMAGAMLFLLSADSASSRVTISQPDSARPLAPFAPRFNPERFNDE